MGTKVVALVAELQSHDFMHNGMSGFAYRLNSFVRADENGMDLSVPKVASSR